MDVIAIVIICAVIQSIIGVGILVFGTPTLLLLGYSFTETVSLLIPSSFMISLLQVIGAKTNIKQYKFSLPLITMPFCCFGFYIIHYMEQNTYDIKLYIGCILILMVIIRSFPKIKTIINKFLQSYRYPYIAIMGLIHGISNMGGALLTIMATSTYKNKEDVRAYIAYGYLFFCSTQMVFIFVAEPDLMLATPLLLPIYVALIYLFIQNFIFKSISNKLFENLINGLLLAYGSILIVQ